MKIKILSLPPTPRSTSGAHHTSLYGGMHMAPGKKPLQAPAPTLVFKGSRRGYVSKNNQKGSLNHAISFAAGMCQVNHESSSSAAMCRGDSKRRYVAWARPRRRLEGNHASCVLCTARRPAGARRPRDYALGTSARLWSPRACLGQGKVRLFRAVSDEKTDSLDDTDPRFTFSAHHISLCRAMHTAQGVKTALDTTPPPPPHPTPTSKESTRVS